METANFETAKRFSFSKEIDYSPNAIVSKKVIDRTSGNVSLFAFDKDQRLSEHTAPFDALIQVLEGHAEIKIDSQPFLLKAGECIIMPANIPHAVYASEQFKMLLTMIKS